LGEKAGNRRIAWLAHSKDALLSSRYMQQMWL
jgi:hypothetical protein